jgi:hypothetical protein
MARPRTDLTGKVYGYLTAVAFDAIRKRRVYWLFNCKCGQENVSAEAARVARGLIRSCGCLKVEEAQKRWNEQFRDLTGQVFGKWTVLSRGNKQNNEWTWNCRCECGTFRVVTGHNLKTGSSKSCGCYRKEFKALPLEVKLERDLAKRVNPDRRETRHVKPGDRFERLVVLQASPDRKYHSICLCDCGKQKVVRNSNLTAGLTKSCGCIKRLDPVSVNTSGHATTMGLLSTDTPIIPNTPKVEVKPTPIKSDNSLVQILPELDQEPGSEV